MEALVHQVRKRDIPDDWFIVSLYPKEREFKLEPHHTRRNLKWGQLVIHMISHDLNMMFGLSGLFTVTHRFFAISQIVVTVPGLKHEGIGLPYPPESNLA
ncbi:hypothetical protein GcM3_185047 [Golovinomyces cichoracearum]|uniref:Uncharacterized protein n=1 Tax=Golovinomyces cichoracearum TaxID=62708 RepID=A0A420HKK4_9PEZI|nr:hypothetical protein GcM3_185047 [Golovinomyces cichoracearum]